MKNLLTFCLLVFSLVTFGQSNSQTVEIKFWKSIAESNDTVAYREYLQRYGENGLYYDEAITRITLLETSGKQAQSKSIECCFYSRYTGAVNIHYVVRFDAEQSIIWLRSIDYDTVRSNLAVSSNFYEDQATLALTRGTREYESAINKDKKAIWEAEHASKYEKNRRKKAEALQKAEQAKSPEEYKNAWTANEEYKYDPMKSTSTRDVYFNRYELLETQYYQKTFYDYPDDYGIGKGRNGYYLIHFQDNPNYEIKKTMQGYRYIAFSKDKSSFIMWFEEDDNFDGVIHEKREYKRIPKEDLLPKEANYDFLNK